MPFQNTRKKRGGELSDWLHKLKQFATAASQPRGRRVKNSKVVVIDEFEGGKVGLEGGLWCTFVLVGPRLVRLRLFEKHLDSSQRRVCMA